MRIATTASTSPASAGADTGKRSAMKVACCVWGGADGKGPGNRHLAGGLRHVQVYSLESCLPMHFTHAMTHAIPTQVRGRPRSPRRGATRRAKGVEAAL